MSLLRALFAAFLLFTAGAGWMMQTAPEEAKSNAAAWLNEFGVGSWGEGFTPSTDSYIQAGLFAMATLAFVALVVSAFWRGGRKSGRRKPQLDFADFDMPILAAIEHMMQTVTHSWDSPDKAERFFFRAIHKQMKAGRLRVMGAEAPGGLLRRIRKKNLTGLTPVPMNVPESDTAPHGVRFDLIDEARLGEPDKHKGPLPGFFDLRVRSKDLYRLWPRTRSQDEGGA